MKKSIYVLLATMSLANASSFSDSADGTNNGSVRTAKGYTLPKPIFAEDQNDGAADQNIHVQRWTPQAPIRSQAMMNQWEGRAAANPDEYKIVGGTLWAFK